MGKLPETTYVLPPAVLPELGLDGTAIVDVCCGSGVVTTLPGELDAAALRVIENV